jgi:hypothetical protein
MEVKETAKGGLNTISAKVMVRIALPACFLVEQSGISAKRRCCRSLSLIMLSTEDMRSATNTNPCRKVEEFSPSISFDMGVQCSQRKLWAIQLFRSSRSKPHSEFSQTSSATARARIAAAQRARWAKRKGSKRRHDYEFVHADQCS